MRQLVGAEDDPIETIAILQSPAPDQPRLCPQIAFSCGLRFCRTKSQTKCFTSEVLHLEKQKRPEEESCAGLMCRAFASFHERNPVLVNQFDAVACNFTIAISVCMLVLSLLSFRGELRWRVRIECRRNGGGFVAKLIWDVAADSLSCQRAASEACVCIDAKGTV
jgi:hypothetical protein